MKLRSYALEELAKMVVGDNAAFPYRSSSFISSFFKRCDLDFRHDGSTRWRFAEWVLEQLNAQGGDSPDMPSDPLTRVIIELFEESDFERQKKSRDDALIEINKIFAKDAIQVYFDERNQCHVRNTGTGVNSAKMTREARPLSKEEIEMRKRIELFLETASEDDFTEKLLVPFFQSMGFHRVSAAGHKEKTLDLAKTSG